MPRLRKVKGRVYIVQGSPNTLIVSGGDGLIVDPGIGEDRSGEIIEALHAAGVERLRAIVLTHGHTDHLAATPGLLEGLPARSPVLAPRLCSGIVENSLLRRLLVYGAPVSAKLAAMPMTELRVSAHLEETSLQGVKPLPLPGHTPGHTGVVVEEEQVVAAGDAVLGEKVLARFGVPFAVDLREWRSSLGKLLELAEAGYTIVPGHGPVVRGQRAETMIKANIEAVDRVYSYVLDKLRSSGEGITLDRLAYMATVELSAAELTPRQLLLNRTALASVLTWLEEEGKAEPVTTRDGVAWKPLNA